MALDFSQVAEQLEPMRLALVKQANEHTSRRAKALELLRGADIVELQRRLTAAKDLFKLRAAAPRSGLNGRYPVADPPRTYTAIAADGSMIEIDRHAPVRCYLINTGVTVLTYGTAPECTLSASSSLHFEEKDLSDIDDADGVTVHRVDGQLLGVEQGIRELEQIAATLESVPNDVPALALIDGPLVVWGLGDPRIKGLIRSKNMLQRYEKALLRVEELSIGKNIGLVGYISYPGTEFVANLVRLAACEFAATGIADCSRHCHAAATRGPRCIVAATSDRELFWRHLDSSERSDIFQSPSGRTESAAIDFAFCYLNTGEEIARLEMPNWLADDERRLDQTLALVMDQVRLGHGYPAALIEAHEQAVINGGDREQFRLMLGRMLDEERLPNEGSAKARSKRIRGV